MHPFASGLFEAWILLYQLGCVVLENDVSKLDSVGHW